MQCLKYVYHNPKLSDKLTSLRTFKGSFMSEEARLSVSAMEERLLVRAENSE